TIASVQNQTYENWELIIVDDCSKDHTVAIVEAFQKDDDRIRLIVSEVNRGSGVARNTGTEASKGDYIAFLDADDLWKPQKLQVQIDFMEAKGYPFTFSFYDAMDEDGNLLK